MSPSSSIPLPHNLMRIPDLNTFQHRPVPKRDLIPKLERPRRNPKVVRTRREIEPQHPQGNSRQILSRNYSAQRIPGRRHDESGAVNCLGGFVIVPFGQLERRDDCAEDRAADGAGYDDIAEENLGRLGL